MTRARWRGRDYDVLRLTEDAEWVLRDEHGDVVVVEDDPSREEVEVQCDRCGRWASGIVGVGPLWLCAATCYTPPPT